MKTVIYARVAVAGRGGDALVERQVEACRRLAHEFSLEVHEVLVDQGPLHGERPAMRRLLELAEAGQVATVVVRTLESLDPGLLESVDLVSRLGRHGVAVRAVQKTPWMLEMMENEPES